MQSLRRCCRSLLRPALAQRPARRYKNEQLPQYSSGLFGEVDQRGGYPSPFRDSLTLKDKLKLAKRAFLDAPETLANTKDYYLYEKVPFRPSDVQHGDYLYLGHFSRDACHSDWVVTTDSHYNEGYSTAEFVPSETGTGLFRGRLSTRVPQNGILFRAGYVNLRSPYKMVLGRPRAVSLHPLNCIVIRYRGDGRTYLLNLHRRNTPYHDNAFFDLYSYPLFTRGGPYWTVCKIPISKLIRNYKGRVQNRPTLNNLSHHQHLSITLGDHNAGPFCLEIDYVAAFYDAHLSEQFAYELYSVSSLMKLNRSYG